jgi:antitoxin MazE
MAMAVVIADDKIVQKWGNSLGLRISAKVAQAARLTEGSPVKLEVVEDGVLIRRAGNPRLTLEQRLERFDPEKHGGEFMPSTPVGREIF